MKFLLMLELQREPELDDNGELVGIVTTGDLVRAELDTLRGHVVTLEDQVMAGGGE